MKCPVCAVDLARIDISEPDLEVVNACPKCRGCWLEATGGGEPSLWADAVEVPVSEEAALSQLACPHCEVQLVTVSPADHAELQIDSCPSCHGLWLDHGELEKLRAVTSEYVAEHGERPAGWSALRWLAYRVAHRHRRPD